MVNDCCSSPPDIEAQILEIQGMKAALVEEGGDQGVGLDSTGYYDQEIYGGSDSRFAGYVTSIAANEQEDVSPDVKSCDVMMHVFFVTWEKCCMSSAICNTEILFLFLGVRHQLFHKSLCF